MRRYRSNTAGQRDGRKMQLLLTSPSSRLDTAARLLGISSSHFTATGMHTILKEYYDIIGLIMMPLAAYGPDTQPVAFIHFYCCDYAIYAPRLQNDFILPICHYFLIYISRQQPGYSPLPYDSFIVNALQLLFHF